MQRRSCGCAFTRAGPWIVVGLLCLAAASRPVRGETIAWWPANEGSGSVVHDSSGHGMDGYVSGADWVPGACGTALDILPAADIVYGIPPTFDDAITDQFSVAARVKWYGEHPGTHSPYSYILDARDGDFEHAGFILFLTPEGRVVLQVGSSSGALQFASSPRVVAGAWTHIAATVDLTAGTDTVRIYIDGAPDVTHTTTGLTYTDTGLSAALGNNLWEDGQYAPLNGALDDVRVADVAWSAAEVAALAGECGHEVSIDESAAAVAVSLRAARRARDGIAVLYALRDAGVTSLRVTDVAGRAVRTLLSGAVRPSGTHTLVWDERDAAGSRVPCGVYVVHLSANGGRVATRVVVTP